MSETFDEVDAALNEVVGTPSMLLGRVIAAIESLGITAQVDWEAETFEITDMPGTDGITTGIVMQRSQAVVFHRVHGEYLDEDAKNRIIPALARANAALDVSAVELNETLGILSVRNAVEIGNLNVGRAVLASLFVAAIQRVAKDAELVLPALLKVASGQATVREAAAEWKPHL